MFVGLREKVVLFIITAIFIIGSVTLWMVNSIQKRDQQDHALQAAERQVQFHKERTLAAIQADLALSLKMADSDIVRRWARHPGDFQHAPAARQELSSFLSLFSTHQAFIASAPEAQLYYLDQAAISAPIVKPTQALRESNTDDRWFFATLTQKNPYNFNIDHNNTLNSTKLWTNVVIKDQGQAIGVVGTGIEIGHFIDEFIHSPIPGLTNIFINEEGLIQGHRQQSLIEQNAELEKKVNRSTIWRMLGSEEERQQLKLALANAQAQSLSNLPSNVGKATRLVLTLDGRPHIVAVAYLPPLKWYAVAAYDAAQLSDFNDFLPVVGVMLIGLLLAALMVLSIGNRLVVAPLQRLAEGARRLADGDYQVRLAAHGADEIGQLTEAFNRMAEKIAQARQQSQITLKTLHASEQRFAAILNAVPDPILITRISDGMVVEINAEVSRNTPTPRTDVIGKTIEELGIWIYPEDRQRFLDLIKSQKRVRNFSCETAMLGVHRYDLISAALIELDGIPHVLSISRDATEQLRQEAALRRSYDMLARIQQIAGMGIWQWYLETDRMLWSKTIYEIYRLPIPNEAGLEPGFVGSMSSLHAFNYIHPQDQQRCLEEVKRTLSQRQMVASQFRIITEDGTVLTLQLEGEVMLDDQGNVSYVFGFTQDISERLNAERAIRASEEKIATLFQTVPEFLAISHFSDGKFVNLNEGFERATGWSQQEALGRTGLELGLWQNPDDRAKFAELLERDGVFRGLEVNFVRKDGSLWRGSACAAIAEINGEKYITQAVHDVTELHRQQAAARASETARQAAEAANQLKSDFLAMISHEVRTPLGGVIGMLRFALRAQELAPDTRSKLQISLSNAEILLQIINDILDYSKYEAGKMQLDMLDFDLHGLVRDVVSILIERAETRGLNLYAEIEPGLPVWWYGDPTRLRQVLVNLIGNAVKFTHQGEVRVKVGLDQDCQIAISVRDSGIGMSADTMSRLFQKFEQADASTARTYGGTGLGLAICKRIVDAMGGSIKVASKLQVGTTFNLCLPLTPGVAPLDQGSESATPNHAWQLAILCAEDGATNQIIVRDLVESMGHTIDIVENGKQALAALASHDYDLVLMDSRMPEMDGMEALRLLREGAHQVRDAHIPVIAVTANVSQNERERFFECGADGFIGKPIHEADLRNEIGRAISTLIQRGKQLQERSDTAAVGMVPPQVPATTPSVSAVAEPARGYHPLLAFSPAARQNLISMYLAEAPRLLQLAREQLAASDAPGLAMTAHSLKGCSGYFDAGELTQICRTLEMAAKAQDWGQVEQSFPAFEATAIQVIEATRTLSFD